MDEAQYLSQSQESQLAQAGLALMSCRSEDEVFEQVSDFIGSILPGHIVLIARASEDQQDLVTIDVLGVDESLVVQAASIAGFEIRGRHTPLDEFYRARYADRSLMEMSGGLVEFAQAELSEMVAKLMGRTFGIKRVYTIGIGDEATIYGALHLLIRDTETRVPTGVIESFVYQCLLALRNIKALAALRDSEARYRILTESIKDVVWTMDPETLRFLYVSPSVERLRGYTPAEVLAQPMDTAVAPESAAMIRAQIDERVARVLSGELHADSFFTDEVDQPCKDGSVVATEVITSLYINDKTGRVEVRGVTRDITERRRSEESLRVFAELLEASPAAVTVHTPDGEFLYANERTLTMHGYTREEFLTLDLHDLDVPEAAALIEERFHWTAEHGENSFEVAHYRKDGSILPLAVSNRVAKWDGKDVILSVATDISERKRAEGELLDSNVRLEKMVYDVAEAMGRIVEARDPYTKGHEQRVAHLAKLLGEEMGLSDDEMMAVEMASVVHDIGKLGVPAEILNKPGNLSELEFRLIREHPVFGYEILKDIDFPWPVAKAVLQHHERVDGSGYPSGLKGDEICPTARIIALADVIEAMASHRPYRPALGVDAAVAEITSHADQYDANVVAACVRLYESGQIVW